MSNLNDRIAKLTPEKRALFLKKLQNRQSGITAPLKKTDPVIAFGPDDNFYCKIGTPGNFSSLSFHGCDKIPPGPGQVQIKAQAASLNFRDLMIAMNLYPATPGMPSNMGSDYAGVVTACGEGVTEFSPGDPVMALSAGDFSQSGQLMENRHFSAYPNVSAHQVAPKPRSLQFEQAAALPTVFLTSYYALRHLARLEKQESVLIHSATGGVGHAAVQIAKWRGARIFATAGTQPKRDYLASIGIAHAMDSRTLDFAETIMKLTEGRGVDVILNTLSGPAAERGIDILNYFGRFIQVDKRDIAENAAIRLGPFKKGLSFSAVDIALFLLNPALMKSIFLELVDRFNANQLQPIPHISYPIQQLGDALTDLSHATHIGKFVLEYA